MIVPAFNEERTLPATLPKVLEIAAAQGDCEVIVVDDGSTDATLAVAGEILEDYPRSELVWHPCNRGKGAAVKSGVVRARGRAVVFVDADLAPDIATGLPRAISELERSPVAIASRTAQGAEVIGGTVLRRALGLGFRTFRRVFMDLGVADTQCGLKAFRAGAARVLFHFLTSNGFVFDVELLLTASRLGVGVAEFPVRWTAVDPSGVRPLRDSVRMATELLRLRYLPGRPPPVPCIRIPAANLGRPKPELLPGALRHGDLVVEGEDEILILLFCAPPEAAASVSTRLTGLTGVTDLKVAPMSPQEAARYARVALSSEDSHPKSYFA